MIDDQAVDKLFEQLNKLLQTDPYFYDFGLPEEDPRDDNEMLIKLREIVKTWVNENNNVTTR